MGKKRKAVDLEIDYIDANMPIYFRFGLLQEFSIQEIRKAAFMLSNKYPFLHSIISDNCFIETTNKAETLAVEQISFLKNDETIFSYTLNADINLFKILFWQGHNSTHFLMILHHAIADVISALQVIEDFSKYLFFPDCIVKKLSMPPSIEEYFRWKPSCKESADYAQNLNQYLSTNLRTTLELHNGETNYEEQTAKMQFFPISEKALDALLIQSKKNMVTINSLLTAYFIKSLSLTGLICVGSAVDLRKRLEKKVPLENLITAPVGAFVFMNVNQPDEVFDIAKNYQKKLLSHINSPKLLLQHYAILRGQLNPFEFNPCFFLSNAGKTSYAKEIEDKIAYTSFTAKVMLNCPYIACISHRKFMNLSITYPDPWISSALIEKIISLLLKEC